MFIGDRPPSVNWRSRQKRLNASWFRSYEIGAVISIVRS